MKNVEQNLMQMLVVTQKGRAVLSLSVFLMIQVMKMLVLKARPLRNKKLPSRFEGFSMY